MKIVISIDNERIAPVFDVARDFICLDTSAKEPGSFRHLAITPGSSPAVIFNLAEEGAEILVCGAISRPLQLLAEANGIIVYGFKTGMVVEIIDKLLGEGPETLACFCMPGCRQQRRRRKQSRQRSLFSNSKLKGE